MLFEGSGDGVICIGGACLDRKYHAVTEVRLGTSNPSHSVQHFGGVARNVAENLARLGVKTSMMSMVGDDKNARLLLDVLHDVGIDTSLVQTTYSGPTAEYCAILGHDGDLIVGVSDFRCIEGLTVGDLDRYWDRIATAEWVFVDTNPPPEFMASLIERRRRSGFMLAVDGVSEAKVRKLPEDLHGVDLLILNEAEAASYLGNEDQDVPPEDRARALQAHGAEMVVITLGARGALALDTQTHMVPAVQAVCTDATGAGDALIAGTIYRLMQNDSLSDAVRIGSLVAALTIESSATVGADLSLKLLEANKYRLKDSVAK